MAYRPVRVWPARSFAPSQLTSYQFGKHPNFPDSFDPNWWDKHPVRGRERKLAVDYKSSSASPSEIRRLHPSQVFHSQVEMGTTQSGLGPARRVSRRRAPSSTLARWQKPCNWGSSPTAWGSESSGTPRTRRPRIAPRPTASSGRTPQRLGVVSHWIGDSHGFSDTT